MQRGRDDHGALLFWASCRDEWQSGVPCTTMRMQRRRIGDSTSSSCAAMHPYEDGAETGAPLLHLTGTADSVVTTGLSSTQRPSLDSDAYSKPDAERLTLSTRSSCASAPSMLRRMKGSTASGCTSVSQISRQPSGCSRISMAARCDCSGGVD